MSELRETVLAVMTPGTNVTWDRNPVYPGSGSRADALAKVGLGDLPEEKVEEVLDSLLAEGTLIDSGSAFTVGYYRPTDADRERWVEEEKLDAKLSAAEGALVKAGLLKLDSDYYMIAPKPSLGRYVTLDLPAILSLMEKAGISLEEPNA